MSVLVLLVGLACGMLVAALSFGLWSDYRGSRAISRGAQTAAWAAAGVLVVGALLAWGSGLPALESLIGVVDRRALEGPVLSLILMAALAVPVKADAPKTALWSGALLYVPASLLASAALVQIVSPDVAVPSTDWVTPIRFSLAVCAGLGARALGQSLQVLVVGVPRVEWHGKLTYALTTLLFGSAMLVNLVQRGTLWDGPSPMLQGRITGAWLAWAADWLLPHRYLRLRAVLTIIAALLLILGAIKPA